MLVVHRVLPAKLATRKSDSFILSGKSSHWFAARSHDPSCPRQQVHLERRRVRLGVRGRLTVVHLRKRLTLISKFLYASLSWRTGLANLRGKRIAAQLNPRGGIIRATVAQPQQTLVILKNRHTAALIAWSHPAVEKGGLLMTIGDLASRKQTEAISAASVISDVRTLIASHLGVSVSCVTDEAHFTKDLGADWLDRLDLMMAVEDQFAGVEITDDDVDRIEVVGDLIRHIGLGISATESSPSKR